MGQLRVSLFCDPGMTGLPGASNSSGPTVVVVGRSGPKDSVPSVPSECPIVPGGQKGAYENKYSFIKTKLMKNGEKL